ncbi:hypothetical protein scyTo_0016526, partial [Scyliorhinus torazame]|nr:hypothetical protein [Scyliorhinus torazame]
MQQLRDMEEVCYEKVLIQLKEGHQVMVFVHARNSTVRTAMALQEMAKNQGDIMYFAPNQSADYGSAEKQAANTVKALRIPGGEFCILHTPNPNTKANPNVTVMKHLSYQIQLNYCEVIIAL